MTPSGGTSPLASYKEVPPPPPRDNLVLVMVLVIESKALYYKNTPTDFVSPQAAQTHVTRKECKVIYIYTIGDV